MNKEYCRRITSRILQDTDNFRYFVTEGNKAQTKELFEEMGLTVKRELLSTEDSLLVLEVCR
jgi:hypothetical protein